MISHRLILVPILAACALLGVAPAPPPPSPAAAVGPVVDDYFGTKVIDSYRWMEDRHSPEFLDWAKAEDTYTRAVLGAIPHRQILLKRIEALDTGGTLIRNVQTAAQIIVYEKRGPD